jgi:hypothetical protein
MKQIHLVVYLESKGCCEVRRDKSGMFVMRNTANNKMSGVPVPSNGDVLKGATICAVCRALDVEVPPSTPKEVEILLASIQNDIENRNK